MKERIGRIFFRLIPDPNIWTIISLVFAGFGLCALSEGRLLLGLILFLIAGLTDGIDGLVARTSGRASSLGAFLDGVTDRYVEFFLYLGLLFYLNNFKIEFFLPNYLWISFLIFGAVMVPFVRAYADHRKLVTDPDRLNKAGGILKRPRRLGLVYLGMFLGLFWPNLLIYCVAAAAILVNLTVFQRIWLMVKH